MAVLFRSRPRVSDASRAALASVLAAPTFELVPLKHAMDQAAHLPPGSTVSVTASPGKGIEATIALAEQLQAAGFRAVPHVAARMIRDRDHLAEIVAWLRSAAVTRAFVVGGDAKEPGAYPDGLSLLRELAEIGHPLAEIGIPCYPEGHVESPDLSLDLANTRVKVDAGADFLITQLFFDNAHYFRFVERARASGILVPILPGIMPFTNVEQVERFTAMCGASIPPPLRAAMQVRRDDAEGALQLGVAYASLQCADLLRRGAPGIHFYTLNRSPSTRAILAALRASEPWRESG